MASTTESSARSRIALLGAATAYLLTAALIFWPLLECRGRCTLDIDRWTTPDPPLSELAKADIALNTWILAWVQHALANQPARLFDANVFHPARHTLTGSEHMLAPALLSAPLRLVTSDANAIYNATVAASFWVAAISTFALTSYLTGSGWIALAGGFFAMLMPWRFSELEHLQLLFAGWLPLVWLLLVRSLVERASLARLCALAMSWTALVFSSYYLAYFGCFTTAALAAVIVAIERVPARRVLAGGAALAIPLVALASFSIPYLHARAEADLVHGRNTIASVPPSMVLDGLTPSHVFAPTAGLPWSGRYSIPLLILVFAACAFLAYERRDDGRDERTARCNLVALGLVAAIAVSLVMSFGENLHVGHTTIPLPSLWAARTIPGFALMRAPMRWTLVVSVALAPLAAIGLSNVNTLLARRFPGVAVHSFVAAAVVASLPAMIPPELPTTPAYPHGSDALAAYGELGRLPAGPAVEIPWPRVAAANAITSSRYMVGSTLHWQPLLNGYTAYKPRSYDFLVRAGARMPERGAVERLSALTDLRWIVVHLDALDDSERSQWLSAPLLAPLVLAYRSDRTLIYEVVDRSRGGSMTARLYSAEPTATTIAGLPRTPLGLEAGDGSLTATFPVVIDRYRDGWASQGVPLRVVNRSERPWPGVDPDDDGLVQVRYRITDSAGATLVEGVSALDDDVPAHGELVTTVLVQGNLEVGDANVSFDLVQLLGDRVEMLPIAPVEGGAKIARVASGG